MPTCKLPKATLKSLTNTHGPHTIIASACGRPPQDILPAKCRCVGHTCTKKILVLIMPDKAQLAFKAAQLIKRLPPMPENINRLLTAEVLTGHADAQVRRLIENDPGLCADLLHLATAACCDSGEQIETIDDAIRQIGIAPLIQLIGVAYAKTTIQKEFAQLERLDEYFQHSRDISLCCRIIAEVLDMPRHDRDVYAVIGLIHDVGRLIIMVATNKTSVSLIGTSWDEMMSIVEDERQLLGMNHCDVGMQLCNKWRFTQILQEAVLRHHTPLLGKDFSFPGAVTFIAHFVSFSDLTGEVLADVLDAELPAAMNMTTSHFYRAQELFQSRA